MIKKNSIIISLILLVLLSSFEIINKSININSAVAINSNAIDGVFNVDKVIIDNNGGSSFLSKYYVSVYFPKDTSFIRTVNLNVDSLYLDTSFVDTITCNPILFRNYAGIVNLNNANVNYINNTNFYIDTTFDLSSNSFNWHIGGNNTINTFTFNNGNPFPSFTYTNNTIPASIDTSEDFQITLNGINNTDSVFITFCRTDSVTKGPFIIKRFSANTDSIFTVQQWYFKQYGSGQLLYLQVALSNYNIKSTAGKNYLFINNFEYKKQIIVNQSQN